MLVFKLFKKNDKDMKNQELINPEEQANEIQNEQDQKKVVRKKTEIVERKSEVFTDDGRQLL